MSYPDPLADLSAALDQFDRAAANLEKADRIWDEIQSAIPDGVAFGEDTPELDNLGRSYGQLIEALPAIDGFRPSTQPMSLDAIAEGRLEAWDLSEASVRITWEQTITKPGSELAEYRYRVDHARRRLTREHIVGVMEKLDEVLRDVSASEGVGKWKGTPRWGELQGLVSELERLLGTSVPRLARWAELQRHLHFGEASDLSDIAMVDWPSVRAEVQASLYRDDEPIPVAVDDLDELVKAHPTGPVRTGVDWSRLTPTDFEGLVFELVRQSRGYENVDWLMRTEAVDRGRDIQAYRVLEDPLLGVERHRVIIQCKHWRGRSVGRSDLIQCVESVRLWEPPLIDQLIVATSGRFSQDAVELPEKRNYERLRPAASLWSDSHLEILIARRPAIAAKFGLR